MQEKILDQKTIEHIDLEKLSKEELISLTSNLLNEKKVWDKSQRIVKYGTEEKKIYDLYEKHLVEKTTLLDAIRDNFPGLLYAKDLEGNLFFVNSNFSDLAPKTMENLIGDNIYELFPTEIGQELYLFETELTINKTKDIFIFEENLKHKDGSEHVYYSLDFPLQREDNSLLGNCVISIDVTSSAKYAQQLYQSELKFRLVAENLNDVIFINSLDGRSLIYVNKAFETIWGNK